MKVRQGLLQYISPQVPEEVRLRAARGSIEPALAPEDLVTVLFVLSFDRSAGVSGAAKKSLQELPVSTAVEALDKRLDPLVVKKLTELHRENEAVMVMAALNEGADEEVLKVLAETGPEEVIAVLSEDRERLTPAVIEGLRKNPLAPPTLLASLSPASVAASEKKGAQKDKAPAPRDLAEDKPDKPDKPDKIDESNIYKAVLNMTVAQKVKLAITGNKSAREFLVKDTNKIVSMAVLKNPRVTEEELTKLISSKSTPEDILRQISHNKDWLKNYNIKLGMVVNPKTPLAVSIKLLDHLYEKDLEKLAKSKNVPSVLASTARRKLETKKK